MSVWLIRSKVKTYFLKIILAVINESCGAKFKNHDKIGVSDIIFFKT